MTLKQIIVFQEAVQSEISKMAALKLNKTQPAISLAIKKLEEELDVELFDRRTYRPRLTDYGSSLLVKSLTVLENFKELQNLKNSFISHHEPEIRIAVDGISPQC